jgi:hypothetical protein
MPRGRGGAADGTSATPAAAWRMTRLAIDAEWRAWAETTCASARSSVAGVGAPSAEPMGAAQQQEGGGESAPVGAGHQRMPPPTPALCGVPRAEGHPASQHEAGSV